MGKGARRRRGWCRGAAALAVAGFALSRRAAGDPGFQRSFQHLLNDGGPPSSFRLEPRPPEAREIRTEDLTSAAEAGAAPPREPRKFWIGVVSVAAVAGSAYNSFGDGPSQGYHFTNEGWFGRDTFLGGADKASHFVSYYVVARLLTKVYAGLGASENGSRLLGAGVSAAAGLMTEIGDGTNKYGFSYEDLVIDWLGAATALATAHYGLDDLIGFRAGLVPYTKVEGIPDEDAFGRDYSGEIYTADVKIAGLAQRLHFNPGPARFLYVSTTYGTKGYPYSTPEVRERQVGFEIGLHISEILRACGVPEHPWWGQALYFAFDTVRFPYTAIGYRYDLNHKKWRGPDTGNSFPGGP